MYSRFEIYYFDQVIRNVLKTKMLTVIYNILNIEKRIDVKAIPSD